MVRTIWNYGRFIKPQTLGTKLILSSLTVMLLAFLGSISLYIIGSNRAQNRILEQQLALDAHTVAESLNRRENEAASAATLLAQDPLVATSLQNQNHPDALTTLNKRAVVMRERFDLDLIQIYNQDDILRTNLVLSSLFRQSTLLGEMLTDGHLIKEIDGRLLLLHRTSLNHDQGIIITGIDLKNELERIQRSKAIQDDLSLITHTLTVSTGSNEYLNASSAPQSNRYTFDHAINLADQDIVLSLQRDTTDLHQILSSGVTSMTVSMLLATFILAGISVLFARSIARPIHNLAVAANAVAAGDLRQPVALNLLSAGPFNIGQNDELGMLSNVFERMIKELAAFYQQLEDKVNERTQDLRAASEVARAASSTLDLKVVLRTSVELVQSRFNFYHVGIFLIDPGSQQAVLREASSGAGNSLISHRHRINIGSRSLVGKSTATARPEIVQDVLQNNDHAPNPFLPKTRSEAVFPFVIGNRVIGAIDVQSIRTEDFTPDKVNVLTTLADQLAVAVQNARLYEKQIADGARLTQVDDMKSQFLENVGHELRPSLNTIVAQTNMLYTESENYLLPQHQDMLFRIHKTANLMLLLVNDLFEISQIHAGETTLSIEMISLGELIDSTLKAAETMLQGKTITLLKTLDEQIRPLPADRMRIRQVLATLLFRAVETTENGYIIIRARPVELLDIHFNTMRPFIEISVSDTGPGLPSTQVTTLFDTYGPQFNLPAKGYTRGGLSLKTCRELIELHGGRIWADSTPGRGTMITFILPVDHNNISPKTSKNEDLISFGEKLS